MDIVSQIKYHSCMGIFETLWSKLYVKQGRQFEKLSYTRPLVITYTLNVIIIIIITIITIITITIIIIIIIDILITFFTIY